MMVKRYNEHNLKESLQGGQKYEKNKNLFNQGRLFNGGDSDDSHLRSDQCGRRPDRAAFKAAIFLRMLSARY